MSGVDLSTRECDGDIGAPPLSPSVAAQTLVGLTSPPP